ncbi:hypothetical protein HN682_05995 [Candidatus Peregrinibacteria bacterium]|jgi:hypothetical protein|nr:hypothetical protein [Candidatus Peregrinibacteria bacterium]
MADKEGLDDKDREILLWIALGLSYDVRIFSERLGQEIERLTRSGVSEQSIIGVLDTDFRSKGRIFGEFVRSVKRGVVGGINQAFRRSGEMGRKLRWITVSKNVCPDCESRAGELDTWEGWESRGMPASGWSVCKEFCYCQLMPEDIEINDTIKI